MKNYPDIALMELIRQGDITAFDALYERYWEKLFITAYNRLGNEEDAKDCVQELFVAIWQKRATLDITTSAGAYLFTALRNRVFNIFRDQAARGKQEQKFFKKSRDENEASDVSDSLDVKELNRIIEEEILAMPEKMREIFILSRKKGLSSKQIANTLSLSPQTVRNQIAKAIQRLRQRVEVYRKGG